MKNNTIAILSSVTFRAILVLLIPVTLWSQPKKPKTDQLAQEADVIIVGKVGQLASEWNEDKSRIQTRVTISVDETIKGTVADQSISLVIPGGEIDGVGEWYSHSVRFEREENVVVFAKKDNEGRFRIPAGEHGKFLIMKDKSTGAKIIPNIGTLEGFVSQIKRNVKPQGADKKQE